ncbi:MAG: hypothetical protein HY788_07080 [Deltaproteobacteria bacterium]|nr:hypothetical protein [Deltaproteobacteria bacterium]
MINWNETLRIVFGGLAAVFFIMTLLAVMTHLVGKVLTRIEQKNNGGK